MQKISIKNFGPIKNVQLEIKDFMLFIGPQATGKSTIAKLIYFFKELEERNYDEIEQDFENVLVILMQRFAQYFENIANWENFEITYYYNTESYFIFTDKNVFISDKLKESLVKREENNQIENDYFFIPAGRSSLFSISSQVQSILLGSLLAKNIENFLDPITLEFMQKWEEIKNMYQHKTRFSLSLMSAERQNSIHLLNLISQNILRGKYHCANGNEEIQLEKGGNIQLRFASSGQQESVRILEYLLLELKKSDKGNTFIVIEEPESNLYPTSQNEIVKAISLFANAKKNAQIIITTHSPYILTSLNNLIFAQEVAKKYPDAQTEIQQIIPQACWLNVEKFAAYYVNEGEIHSIIEDSNLIGINELDNASDDIMDTFDEIMSIYKKNQSLKKAQ